MNLTIVKVLLLWLTFYPTVVMYAQGNEPIAVSSFQNPGRNINSRFEETKPIPSPDGSRLYFARKYAIGNTGGMTDPQDIYFSETTNGLRWGVACNAGPSVNTPGADNLFGILHDNSFVFYIPDGKNNGHLATRAVNRTSVSRTIGPDIENESPYLEGYISPDGQTILFTAKTKNNLYYRRDVDERDIYISRRDERGWSTPQNIGMSVNTSGDEFSPFLGADGRTLYFASDGHQGLGDVDIFVSRRIGEGWTSWTRPENLGPEINTDKFDGYLSVNQSGNGYFVSKNKSLGKSDILTVMLPARHLPASTGICHLKVRDEDSGEPVRAHLILHGEKEISSEAMTDQDGTTALFVPSTRPFQVVVNSEDYLAFTVKIADCTSERTILLKQVRPKMTTIEDVLFEQGSPSLVPSSYGVLDSVAHLLQLNPSMRIRMVGHTDNVGTERALKLLSESRVSSVIGYLHKSGIPLRRLSGRGVGATQPIADNKTEKGRMKNRRVEFIIKRL